MRKASRSRRRDSGLDQPSPAGVGGTLWADVEDVKKRGGGKESFYRKEE